MHVLNRSHYFTEASKIYNEVPDPNSFRYQSSRRMGFFQRIYFEHLYTLKVGGQSFFETFTYNDMSIPYFTLTDPKTGHTIFHRPCFSYKDIRLITNGKLSKILDRKYGSRLRYFCACESGEGKGKRGEGNNPHYHFIFFIQPKHDSAGNPIMDSYKPINSFEFNRLLRELWQGSDGYVPFRNARFGIVKPGMYNGIIQSADAFKYVGKYVIKDVSDTVFESELSKYYFKEVMSRGITPAVFVDYFHYLRYYLGVDFHFQDYVDQLSLREYRAWLKENPNNEKFDYQSFITWSGKSYLETKVLLLDIREWFDKCYVPCYVSTKLSDYKSECSAKPRMSKSLGEYGLQFVKDIDTKPRFLIPVNGKYETQYPCLYYIRKLYYDTFVCPETGNVLYQLSPLGKTLKKNSLFNSVNDMIHSTYDNLTYVLKNDIPVFDKVDVSDNRDLDSIDIVGLFKQCPSSSIVLSSDLHRVSEFFSLSNRDYILRAYSIYKLVYEYRHFKVGYMPSVTSDLTISDVMHDYDLFLSLDKYFLDYDHSSVALLVSSLHSRFRSYIQIEPFKSLSSWFKLLDSVNDCCSGIRSDSNKQMFKERSDYLKSMKAFLHTPMVI